MFHLDDDRPLVGRISDLTRERKMPEGVLMDGIALKPSTATPVGTLTLLEHTINEQSRIIGDKDDRIALLVADVQSLREINERLTAERDAYFDKATELAARNDALKKALIFTGEILKDPAWDYEGATVADLLLDLELYHKDLVVLLWPDQVARIADIDATLDEMEETKALSLREIKDRYLPNRSLDELNTKPTPITSEQQQ